MTSSLLGGIQTPPLPLKWWRHLWTAPYSVPCLWVGWWLWRAGCISQDTYLLYDTNILKNVFPYPIILEFPSIPILTSIFLLTASQPRHLQAAPGSNRTIIAALVELALTPVPLQYYLLIVWSSIHFQWYQPVSTFDCLIRYYLSIEPLYSD